MSDDASRMKKRKSRPLLGAVVFSADEFWSLWDKRNAALLLALVALRKRIMDAGLGKEPGFSHTFSDAMETFIMYPETMMDPKLHQAMIVMRKVAQYWAPGHLAQRWDETRLGRMYIDYRKKAAGTP